MCRFQSPNPPPTPALVSIYLFSTVRVSISASLIRSSVLFFYALKYDISFSLSSQNNALFIFSKSKDFFL